KAIVWPSLEATRDAGLKPFNGAARSLVFFQLKSLWNHDADLLGGLVIDEKLELVRLFHRQLSGPRALQDLVHVGSGAAEQIGCVHTVRHQASCIDVQAIVGHCRESVLNRPLEYRSG